MDWDTEDEGEGVGGQEDGERRPDKGGGSKRNSMKVDVEVNI